MDGKMMRDCHLSGDTGQLRLSTTFFFFRFFSFSYLISLLSSLNLMIVILTRFVPKM